MNDWVFTFGVGQPLRGRCVRIKGGQEEARTKMFSVFGTNWACQYSAEEWQKILNNPNRRWRAPEEIDLRGDIFENEE